jgi:hypothetical protein
MNFDVYYLNGTESAALTARDKGYRSDVYVRYGSLYFRLSVYDRIRLIQDFNEEIDTAVFFCDRP